MPTAKRFFATLLLSAFRLHRVTHCPGAVALTLLWFCFTSLLFLLHALHLLFIMRDTLSCCLIVNHAASSAFDNSHCNTSFGSTFGDVTASGPVTGKVIFIATIPFSYSIGFTCSYSMVFRLAGSRFPSVILGQTRSGVEPTPSHWIASRSKVVYPYYQHIVINIISHHTPCASSANHPALHSSTWH